ncbi:hypothetical protein [Kineosporia babensis]|uniref:Uncharacterized protein n=1 Tax=Kineosporia babensis TaxID=499548 RepID=A0A9X1NB07_9ACTN|nr:hypothetical protein [Kineosporia babensis]MCD5309738.1 hypothetical protein [Kineosporia babensis]
MTIFLRSWLAAGLIFVAYSLVLGIFWGDTVMSDGTATVMNLGSHALAVAAAGLLYRRRAAERPSMAGFAVSAILVSLLWHLLSVWIWLSVDVAGNTVTQRTFTWLITVVAVAVALWFVPVRRAAQPAAYR